MILEKHVCSVLLSFLQSRDVFSPNQFGFVSGRGTQKAVEEVSDFLNEAIDQNEFACALFLEEVVFGPFVLSGFFFFCASQSLPRSLLGVPGREYVLNRPISRLVR